MPNGTTTLTGIVVSGTGHASTKKSSRSLLHEDFGGMVKDIVKGTVNVQIDIPRKFQPDDVYPIGYRDLYEDVLVTRCTIVGINGAIIQREPALITVAGPHFHGPTVLEIMGRENFGQPVPINYGDTISVEVDSSKIIY